MEIKNVHITRILNPTSIDLGEYVINPYKGCGYACLYCYVRFNKSVMKDHREWGDYVDARINAPELLEKELKKKKPERVLLGSTTECFAPYERKLKITSRILDILNENGVKYSILTRSPFVLDQIEKLKAGYCENIYFTVNSFDKKLKNELEPKSPDFLERRKAIKILHENKISVIPYFSPILPGISHIEDIFGEFKEIGRVEFEGLNFNLGNIDGIIKAVRKIYPQVAYLYEVMKKDKNVYDEEWGKIKKGVMRAAIKYKMNHDVYVHSHTGYFENKYL